MKYLAASMLCVLLAGSAAVLAAPIPELPEQDTSPSWVVVYRWKQDNPNMPDCRIYVVVKAAQEGEAAVKAFRFLQDKLAAQAADSLTFVEAQKRDDGK